MITKCGGCGDGVEGIVDFSMAFQPIVDSGTGNVFAYEALVRGLSGEGAQSVLDRVNEDNRYSFDQQCRVKALELATKLGVGNDGSLLSINFLPKAVYEPRACIRLTLETAKRLSFPLDKIMFEFTENEILDTAHVANIVREYRAIGFKIAIDDFGAGYAGLELLTRIVPHVVKIDMDLVRDIDRDDRKRTVVKHTVAMLRDLGITPVCEGVETAGEWDVLTSLGVSLFQGYLLAKPMFEALPHPRVIQRA
jgi:EAL domain-containing protein (putative c-di-GMP-specific phosphodiesterase class I)